MLLQKKPNVTFAFGKAELQFLKAAFYVLAVTCYFFLLLKWFISATEILLILIVLCKFLDILTRRRTKLNLVLKVHI